MEQNPTVSNYIKEYLNGRDITQSSRGSYVIDAYGLDVEQLQKQVPSIYQWLLHKVKPERDVNKRESRKKNWWLFGETNPKLRLQLKGLTRYIATVETSKHRFFVFLDAEILPDNKLINFALEDAYFLGILSSFIHVCWALAVGSTLEDRPVYVKTTCFETFPFPDATEAQKARIRELGERLDAHRKARQAAHPTLTMTGMYNVLEKLRSGEPLSAKEKEIHEQGLVSVLKEIHDDLDAAVFEAYGWPTTLTDEEILERLVALNAERAAEEKRGIIRYLRPEFQDPKYAQQTQIETGDDEEAPVAAKASPAAKAAWPRELPAQVQAVRDALRREGVAITPEGVAALFKGAKAPRVQQILDALAALGQCRVLTGGTRYQAV